MRPTNIFTVDLEDWYHANYRTMDLAGHGKESAVVAPTLRLLDLLRKYDSRATFFCLGLAAEAHKNLIEEIVRQGHEIASHSYGHELVYRQGEDQFEADLRKVTDILRRIVGEQPVGYRAPSWSVDRKKTPWFWDILEANGYKYSSSLFPLTTFLYGDSSAPRFRHNIGNLFEVPPSTIEVLGRRMAFSGGFYLRMFPASIIRIAAQRVNSLNMPVVYYIHPREIDPGQPRIPGLSTKERFIHYYNIGGTFAKLEGILQNAKTCSMREYLRI